MSDYTPGPWVWVKNGYGYKGLYGSGNHDIVIDVRQEPLGWYGSTVFCEIERESDANLIASAPDLLAALEYIVQARDCSPYQLKMAEKAIAKAKGENK